MKEKKTAPNDNFNVCKGAETDWELPHKGAAKPDTLLFMERPPSQVMAQKASEKGHPICTGSRRLTAPMRRSRLLAGQPSFELGADLRCIREQAPESNAICLPLEVFPVR